MAKLIIRVVLVSLALVYSTSAETIYTLISRGHLGEARDSLSKLASAASRDGDVLFYQSLLEPDAEQSVRLMKAALSASVSTQYREMIYYRLAQHHLLKKEYRDLSRLLADYHSLWESGQYHSEMKRISILLDELVKDYDSALRQCDRFLVEFSGAEREQWGRIDKARILNRSHKTIGVDKMLRKLSRAKSGSGIPQALYFLGMEAVRQKRADDAVFYYNLLREGYPSAVGLDSLIEALGGLTAESSFDNAAEKLTGTFYSVKVGVFSESANARKQASKFKGYGHKIETKTRTISGKKYRVVYVGRFQSYQKAVDLKAKLEAAHNEVFQVVTR